MEEFAKSDIIRHMLYYDNVITLKKIIEWRKKEYDMTDEEAEEFKEKYIRGLYFSFDRIKSVSNEKDQECFKGTKIYKHILE